MLLLTYWGWDKIVNICRPHFLIDFIMGKWMCLDSNATELCFKGPIDNKWALKWVIILLSNGLSLALPQACTWTNAHFLSTGRNFIVLPLWQENAFENVICKMVAILSLMRCVKTYVNKSKNYIYNDKLCSDNSSPQSLDSSTLFRAKARWWMSGNSAASISWWHEMLHGQ